MQFLVQLYMQELITVLQSVRTTILRTIVINNRIIEN